MSKHAQSLGDGVDAFRLRPIASRLHESRHARRVGRRAFGPPVRVHQLFGPRLRRRRQGDGTRGAFIGGGSLERPSLGTGAQGPGLPLGVEAGQNQRARPRSRRGRNWALPNEAFWPCCQAVRSMHLRCRLKSCSSLCIEWHEKALWPGPPGDNATAECVPKVYRSGTVVSTGLSMPKGPKAVQ